MHLNIVAIREFVGSLCPIPPAHTKAELNQLNAAQSDVGDSLRYYEAHAD